MATRARLKNQVPRITRTYDASSRCSGNCKIWTRLLAASWDNTGVARYSYSELVELSEVIWHGRSSVTGHRGAVTSAHSPLGNLTILLEMHTYT
eukprot:473104-Amorphochlora_amoeboformis.AAC.1